MPFLAGLLAAVLAAPAPPPPATDEDRAVVAVVQAFFDGLAAADPAAMRATMLPDGRFMSLRTLPDGAIQTRRFTFEDSFGKRIEPGLEEVMWSPQVVRRGALATLTAPYEFRKGGVSVHCGVDVFTLVRQEGAWRIADVSWTAEPDACAELKAR